MINIMEMLKYSKEINKYLEKAKEQKAAQKFEIEVGGGQVKLTVNGNMDCLDLHIDKQLLNPDEYTTLTDLLRGAINQANKKVQKDGNNDIMEQAKQMLSSGNFDIPFEK